MAISLLAPTILAGAIAAAIAAAPMAAAEPDSIDTGSLTSADSPLPKAAPKPRSAPNNATSDYNSSHIPQGWRNDALWARPGASNPFGPGIKRPPMVALD